MKKILVTQNIYSDENRAEFGDKLDSRLLKWLLEGGYFPIPISNFLLTRDCKADLSMFNSLLEKIDADGLLLSGGVDIGISLERDRTETQLVNQFEERNLPILGICRGMQFLGLREGGKLEKTTGHSGTEHDIFGRIACNVNSFHNWGFFKMPEHLETLAVSEDGCIEAFKHKTKNIVGLMWHPERDDPYENRNYKILMELFG